MYGYVVPVELTDIRDALSDDPMRSWELVDDAVRELKHGIFGEKASLLYKSLASNSFLYKKVPCSFEDWLKMLTLAEICLMDLKRDYIVISENNEPGLSKKIDYKGHTGALKYDVDKYVFRLSLDSFSVLFDIPGLQLNKDIFFSDIYLSKIHDLVRDLRVA